MSSCGSVTSPTARFAWLAGVSDMVTAAGSDGEEEEEQAWLDNIITSGNLPVCAVTCGDGELYYRTLGAWCVPWSKAPLDRFLPAWFRLPAQRRRTLRRKLKYFAEELCEEAFVSLAVDAPELHPIQSCWVARMCDRDDARMMGALAAVEPQRLAEEGTEAARMQPFLAAQGGPMRRAIARRFKSNGAKHQWERELVRLCVASNAVECMAAWAQSRAGRVPVAYEVGLECVQLGRLAMLRLLVAVDPICNGPESISACKHAAAAGQLECLRFLAEEAGYTWNHFTVWCAAEYGRHRGVHGCADCALYLAKAGCPTVQPPSRGGGGLMSLLAYGGYIIDY